MYIQTQGSGAVFFFTLHITLILREIGKIDSRLMPNHSVFSFKQCQPAGRPCKGRDFDDGVPCR